MKLASFISGIFAALIIAAMLNLSVSVHFGYHDASAQVGGSVAELNADDVYVNDDLTVTGDATIGGGLTVTGTTIIDLPDYADDTAACTGGLGVGDIYHDSDGATVVSVAACS